MRVKMNEGDVEVRTDDVTKVGGVMMDKGVLPERRSSAGDLSTASCGGSDFDHPVVHHDVAWAEEAADAVVNSDSNMEVSVDNTENIELADTHHAAVESELNLPFLDHGPYHDETSVHVSDISGSVHSKSSLDKPDAWMEATAFEPRLNYAVNDHVSMRSHRETVDRLLMSGAASSIGVSDRGEVRSCMEVNVNETFAHTYDHSYYRSGDWLRFVPRRSSISNRDGSSGSSDYPSHDFPPSYMQQVPYGYPPPSFNPDHYYRGFDNTAIRRFPRYNDLNDSTRRVIGVQSEHARNNLFGPRGTFQPIDEEKGEKERSVRSANHYNFASLPREISISPQTELSPKDFQVACEATIQQVETDPQAAELNCPSPQLPSPLHVLSHPSHPTSPEDQMHLASWDSKFESYACRVDQSQDDSSVEIAIFSMERPHMRAFHFAWLTFFFAFMAWFSVTPLLHEIQTSLHLSKEEIWTSSICSAAGAVFTRCLAGLLCDMYGARVISAAVLIICGIPTMLTGLVNTAFGLSAVRLCSGFGGSAFVTCQYWTSTMFTREVSGTANALAAGWGNLGGGICQILVGTILFPLFKLIYSSAGTQKDPATLSWRTCCIIPGFLCASFSYFVIRHSDDSPKGNYHKRKRLGLMQNHSAWKYIKSAISDHNTLLLFLMYGCCFGVEITTTNAAALYFTEEFQLSTESAAAVAFTFGGMNLFARGVGGFLSDASNAYMGMRGRLIWQFICFAMEGFMIMVFSKARSLSGSIAALMTFSIFVQGAEGSTFGIVPYLNPELTGTVAGIIGAGGNTGAVIFSIVFQQLSYRDAFFWMGTSTACISILSSLVWIKGYQGLFFRQRVLHSPQKRSQSTTLSHQATDAPVSMNIDSEKNQSH